jgi:hypothetical protein
MKIPDLLPRTAAGQRLYEGIAIRGLEHKALRDILAIEAEAAEQSGPPLDVLRCVKCGGTDISTRWDRHESDCTWSSRRDPGIDHEHLHRHCRTCSYGWGDPIAALSEKP